MMTLRLQIILIIFMVIAFIFFINLLQKKMLETKYSLIWLFCIIAIIILCLNPLLIDEIAAFLGVYTAMNAIFFIAISVLACISILLTIAVSRLSGRIKLLVQTIALLDKEHNGKHHSNPDEATK